MIMKNMKIPVLEGLSFSLTVAQPPAAGRNGG
jgi:hypothetical protein